MIVVMTLQFICRGNAFRSIIAEAYLKSLQIPGLTVISSGTVASAHKEANKINYPKVIAVLKRHGIEQYAKKHYADDINQGLLDESDIVVCLNKLVYEEAISGFRLPKRVYVWDVADIDEADHIPTTEAEFEAALENGYEQIVKDTNDFIKSGVLSDS